MVSLVPTDLGAEGLTYLKDELRGLSEICDRLSAHVSLHQGACFAPLPPATPIVDAKDFKTGGKVVKMSDTMSWLQDSLCKPPYLSREVFFCDLLARRSDPYMSSKRLDHIYFHEEVLYYLAASARSPADIEARFMTLLGMRYVVFLAQTKRTSSLQTRTSIDQEFVAHLVEHCVTIIVYAYDSEGAVIWNRTIV